MTVDVWEALLLGAVQGATEWLPVSSSAHLVLAQELLGVRDAVLLDALLHLGTLVVVVAFFRRDLAAIARALATAPRDARRHGWRSALAEPHRRLALLVLLATLPAGVVGFAFADFFERAFANLLVASLGLLATGTLLFATRWAEPRRPEGDLTARDALVVGCAQAVAILPGVSRSGSTIGAALFLGVERVTAARFSFLLSIPTLAGAAVLEVVRAPGEPLAWESIAAGVAAAMLVGWLTLAFLMGMIKRWGLSPFAWYCWAVGAAGVAIAVS